MDLNQTPIKRTLGVFWDPDKDGLRTKTANKKFLNTKQGILSFVGLIFDSSDILTPAFTELKCGIQDIWKHNIDWDHAIQYVK